MAIRVLFISQYAGVGGAQKSLINLIIGLREYGIEPTVLIPKKGKAENEFKKYGIPYIVFRFASMRIFTKNPLRIFCERMIRIPLNYFQGIRIKRMIQGKFDMVHSNSSLVFFGHNISKRLSIPLIWHLREYGDIDYPMSFLSKNVVKYFNRASAIITISDAMTKHYKATVSPAIDYLRIYDDLDATGFTPASHTNSTTKICIVGGVTPSKNQIEVIEALGLLKNYKFELDIIGNCSDEYKCILTNLIKDLNLEDKISFLGQRNDISKILCNYDIGITPSLNEGFGRVTIEYMISNLAVICSDSGANSELIEDGKNGLLYPLGDKVKLAEKIKFLIDNPHLMSLISAEGRKNALAKYCAGNCAKEIYNLYKSLNR